MRFSATFDASGVKKGTAEAVASMKSVSVETDKAAASLRNAAKDTGHYYDTLGRLPTPTGGLRPLPKVRQPKRGF